MGTARLKTGDDCCCYCYYRANSCLWYYRHAHTHTRRIAMAENAAPGSANNAGADSSRGMPYYERLRRDLRESLNKKRLIDNNLVSTARDAS